MDYRIAHLLDRFSAGHDWFEDALGAYVGAAEIIFALALLVLFFALPARMRPAGRRAAVAAGAAFVVAIVIAHFLSVWVDRPRPFVAHPATIKAFLAHAADPSMPSDHATATFAIATAVILRLRGPGVVLLVLALLVSAGRVFLGLHYPSDVLVGALLGAGTALALWWRPPRELLDRLADALGGVVDASMARLRPGRPDAGLRRLTATLVPAAPAGRGARDRRSGRRPSAPA